MIKCGLEINERERAVIGESIWLKWGEAQEMED